MFTINPGRNYFWSGGMGEDANCDNKSEISNLHCTVMTCILKNHQYLGNTIILHKTWVEFFSWCFFLCDTGGEMFWTARIDNWGIPANKLENVR